MLSDCCLSDLSVTLVYCGQMVGWTKVKLGVQVGLGRGHIVLDEDPAPLSKGAQPPSLGNIVLDGDPAPPPLKGHTPKCRPMSIVAKRLDGLSYHLVWR